VEQSANVQTDSLIAENIPMEKLSARQILARNLRALMDKRGLKQKQLEALTGVYQSTISTILNCHSAASIDTVEQLAARLKVDTWELLVDSEEVYRSIAERFIAGSRFQATPPPQPAEDASRGVAPPRKKGRTGGSSRHEPGRQQDSH
jgi:transcriptional regulator with XRE-family HTH domain